MSLREQMRGFPVWQISVLGVMRILEPISFTSLFPYMYFMIRDFGIAPTDLDIPKYSGYLASSFALMQVLFSIHWGRASDRYGRKVVLLTGLAGTSVSLLVFGFSKNYYVALLARCMMGALNGNIPVLRTAIGEIAGQKRHQSIAFSTLPLLWSVGQVIGPAIGSSKYLTRPGHGKGPSDSYLSLITMASVKRLMSDDSFYDRFITKHPYALSNIVVALFLWFSIAVGFLFFEETHPDMKNTRDRGLEIGDYIRSKLGFEIETRPWNRKMSEILEEIDEFTPLNVPLSDDEGKASDAVSIVSVKKRFNQGIFNPGVVNTIVANFILCFHYLICWEFLPVMLAGTLQKENLKFPFTTVGGFGYSSEEIGSLLSVVGVIGILVIIFIFPWVDRNVDTVFSYRVAAAVIPMAYIVLPYLVFTLPEVNPAFGPHFTKMLLYALSAMIVSSSSIGFPQCLMLIHRASHPKHRAFINAVGLTFTSLARCVAPLVWGPFMSLTEKYSVSWISWVVLAFIGSLGFIQTFFMVDHAHEEHEEEVEE